MLETNIRIVSPGTAVSVSVRRGVVEGPAITPELLQRLCGILRYRHGLAAVPSQHPGPSLLVATDAPIHALHIEGEDLVLDVKDAAEPTERLEFSDPVGTVLLPTLLERALLAKLALHTNLWTLDSPSIWYEAHPFQSYEGIAVYRRFEIASLIVEGVGVGIVADVGTAFFTTDTLAFFFDSTLPRAEQDRRHRLFAGLTGRQQGQKGTLLYDTGRTRVKCYFDDAPRGMTCATTGKVRAKGKTYDSLLDYYRVEIPELPVLPDTLAIRVSFLNLDRSQWVAASRVRIRVMNDDTPESLKSVDKIAPECRRNLLQDFWKRLEPEPLGPVAVGFDGEFWRPDPQRLLKLEPVCLEFGDRTFLPAPPSSSVEAYRDYYRRRLRLLDSHGCYSLPSAVTRTVYCAYPQAIGEEVASLVAGEIVNRISGWAGRQFAASLVAYDSTEQAIEQLRRSRPAQPCPLHTRRGARRVL